MTRYEIQNSYSEKTNKSVFEDTCEGRFSDEYIVWLEDRLLAFDNALKSNAIICNWVKKKHLIPIVYKDNTHHDYYISTDCGIGMEEKPVTWNYCPICGKIIIYKERR